MERNPNEQAIKDARAMVTSARAASEQSAGQRLRLDAMRIRNEAMRLRIRRALPPLRFRREG
jgi:hypothetical protein